VLELVGRARESWKAKAKRHGVSTRTLDRWAKTASLRRRKRSTAGNTVTLVRSRVTTARKPRDACSTKN
jgi:hypothetical protein